MINQDQHHFEEKLKVKLEGLNASSFVNLSKKIDSTGIIQDDYNDPIQSNNEFNFLELKKQSSNHQSPSVPPSISRSDLKRKCDSSDQDVTHQSKQADNLNQFEFSSVYSNKQFELETPQNRRISSVSPTKTKKLIMTAKSSEHMLKFGTYKTIQNFQPGASQMVKQKFSEVNGNGAHTKLNFFSMKPLVMKYIENYTSFGRFRSFNLQSRMLISDKADYVKIENKKNIFLQKLKKSIVFLLLQFQNAFLIILNKIPLSNPENQFRILINTVIVCYNCFYLLTVSFNLFFQANFGEAQQTLNHIAIAAWVTEMLMQMNTATYYDGDFITDRKTLFQIYLKEYFFFEILPLIFEGKTSNDTMINICLHLPLLLKLKGMSIILSKLEFLILQHLQKHYILQIFKILIQLVLLTHLMACSYITLAKFEQNILDITNTWIENSTIITNSNDWWSAYIEAQLWAYHTMGNSYSTSVFTQYEYAFTSFWMLISCVLYAYLINSLGHILSDINSNTENYKRDINILNKYMKRKKIDLELQRMMNTHLVKQYEQDSQLQYELEQETLNKLSQHMRNKLVTVSNKNILSQFSFFQLFSKQTLTKVYQIMQEESFSEGQLIPLFDENTHDTYVYLILQGSVEIMQTIQLEGDNKGDYLYTQEEKYKEKKTQQLEKKTVKKLNAGSQFGEHEFFSSRTFPYIVNSQKQTSVIKISRNQFIGIVKQHKVDYQRFMEIYQRVRFNNEMSVIKSECMMCSALDHHFVECNRMHYHKNQLQFTLSKYLYSENQERKKQFNRRIQKFQRYVIHIVSQNGISQTDLDETQSQRSSEEKDEDTLVPKDATSILQHFQKDKGIMIENSKQDVIEEQINEDSCSVLYPNTSTGQRDASKKSTIPGGGSFLSNIPSITNVRARAGGHRQSLLYKKSQIQTLQENFMSYLGKEQCQSAFSEEKSLIKFSNSNLDNRFQHSNTVQTKGSVSSNINGLRISFLNLPHIQNVDTKQQNEGDQIQQCTSNQDILQRQSDLSILSSNQKSILQVVNKNVQPHNQGQQKLSADYSLKFMTWDESLQYWEFDKICEFLYFFPHNNFKNIFRKFYNKERARKLKKICLSKKPSIFMSTSKLQK